MLRGVGSLPPRLIFISIACLMVAYNLAALGLSIPALQLLQPGQALRFEVIFVVILHARPEDALTLGAVVQTARLFGGEISSAFVTTLARVREQVAWAVDCMFRSGAQVCRIRTYGP